MEIELPKKLTPAARKGRIPVYAEVDRDLYFLFRDLLKSHGLDIRQGISWGMRTLLMRAGVEVKPDRGERKQGRRVDEASE